MADLLWGLHEVVPDDAKAVWGARTILSDGYVDIVHDRTDWVGEKKDCRELSNRLSGALKEGCEKVKKLWGGEIRGNEANEVVLYEDEFVALIGNTNGSYGYLYLAAWLKSELAKHKSRTRGF